MHPRLTALTGALLALAALAACSTPSTLAGADPAAGCATLAGATVPASAIGLPSGTARVETASFVAAAPLAVLERAPTPAARIVPAVPDHCRLLGRIAPLDPAAPDIRFQLNLPVRWNGRSVQYGGGGFNGVLISGLALVPGAPYEGPVPLAQGYATVGTDSGHETKPGVPPQAFALNDEALVNFAHASYKKVRDVSVALMTRAYGRGPQKLYFVGSSEGGREGLTMAQRYPADFDGILSRVPVIHWTALQHVGLRDGLALTEGGWMDAPRVRRVHEAVLAACDAADGLADGIVSDPVGCSRRFDVGTLACGAAPAPDCLTPRQVEAVRTLGSPLVMPVPLAHGAGAYPGRGPSGEGLPAAGPTGGWMAWWTGASAPAMPPQPSNGIGWFYGAGAIQYFYARDPQIDLRAYRALDHAARIREVSALMGSTNPDLSAFHARGGRLIVLENMADYAQSPYAGIGYVDSVVATLGRERVETFLRLYTAPGVDHVGSGAPANADLFGALVDWVERDRAPGPMTLLEQAVTPPFAVTRARPLCRWPEWPRHQGGDPALASSFACVR
jgi:feruloyl esterase